MRNDAVQRGAGREMAGPAHEAWARGRRLPSSSSSRCGTAWCRHRARCCSAGRCRWSTARWCRWSRPRSSISLSNSPTCMSCSTMPSLYSSCPEMPRCSAFTCVRKCMRVPFHQTEERLAGLGLALDEVLGGGDGFVVDGLHALLGQRAGVLDLLAALAVGPGLKHATRAEFLAELRVLWIVQVLRLLFGVQVIEVAEELVEAVHGGQMLVAVALVVLAELSGGVALSLEHGGHGDVGLLPAFLGAGQADLGHAGADGDGAADEGRATRRAALLRVVIGEAHAFLGDAIDVRRLVAHHAAVVVADVPGADVVAPDDEDVGLFVRRLGRSRGAKKHHASHQQRISRSSGSLALSFHAFCPFVAFVCLYC